MSLAWAGKIVDSRWLTKVAYEHARQLAKFVNLGLQLVRQLAKAGWQLKFVNLGLQLIRQPGKAGWQLDIHG